MLDVHKTIDNALSILKNEYKGRNSAHLNYEENIPKISCNPGKLVQMFINLIGNSVDAIKESGEIQIDTKSKNQSVIISIKDSGEGMDNET